MGKMETEARSRRRRGYLQYAVLATVGIAGIILVGMAAPNTLQLLGKTRIGKRFNEQAHSAISRLARRGLVVFVERGGKKYARITDKGKQVLMLEQQKATLSLARKRRWDKRYRIVMFDISERRRFLRVKLRNIVRGAGFLRLQDSVWVFPHDCEDFIALLKADLHLGREVIYVIADSIENDTWVRKHFGLKLK